MQTIELKKYSLNLNTRPLADSIFMKLKVQEDILIDFTGVISATPSFCHEMLLVLKEKRAKAKFVNFNDTVKFQIQKASTSISSK